MKTKGWENIYKEQGEIYTDINPQVKKCAKIFKKKGYTTILDLGCGTGRHSIFLAQKGFLVYASDISKTGIAITKKKARSLDLNMKFKVFDMKSIPYPTNHFDGVICIFTLGHGLLEDNKRAIDEIYRVLKPGGMVVTEFVSVKDKTYGKGKEVEKNTFLGSFEEDKHMLHHYFTKDEIKTLLSKFTKIEISPKEYWGEVKAFDVEAIK
jgi:ubiquinone/menaquinone biosynthesis C-methylase UbiE